MSLSPSGSDSAKSWEFSLWGRLSDGTLTVWVWISRMLGVCPRFYWHPPVGKCLRHMFLSETVVTFGVVREEGVSFLSAESFSGRVILCVSPVPGL